MTAGASGADGAGETQAKAQEEIRSWGTRSMVRLRHMAPQAIPQAILAGMTVAAFTPVLAPLIQANDVAAAVQASLGQFGGAGAGYLAAIAQQFADRQREREAPPLTEEKLAELLETKFEADLGSANSAVAQAAIRDLVLGVSGIHVLLKTAAQGGQLGVVTHLVRALGGDPSLLAAAVGALDSLRVPDTDRQP